MRRSAGMYCWNCGEVEDGDICAACDAPQTDTASQSRIRVPVDYALIQLDLLRESNEKLIKFYMDQLGVSINILNRLSVLSKEQSDD